METTTPGEAVHAPRFNYRDVGDTQRNLDDLMADEDMEWCTNKLDVPESQDPWSSIVEDTEEEVRPCYCQEPPSALPPHYTPCCLPFAVSLSKREIQMFPEFGDSLLGKVGTSPKTQTLRMWGERRTKEHYRAFVERKWIRVWRGQGNAHTIGWLLITDWDVVQVKDINAADCVREGLPKLSPEAFTKKYLRGLTPTTNLTRLRFRFRPCHACA
jgi:hypothetical protein